MGDGIWDMGYWMGEIADLDYVDPSILYLEMFVD